MRDISLQPMRRLFGAALLVLLLSQILISWFAWQAIEDRIRPELDRKARAVALSLGKKVERALELGIPFERLGGVEEFFAEVLRDNPDLSYIALSDRQGSTRFASGLPLKTLQSPLAALPVSGAGPQLLQAEIDGEKRGFYDTARGFTHGGRELGQIHVGVDRAYLSARISGLRYDIGIVLLTSMLIAFEILLFVLSVHYLAPMNQIGELMQHMGRGDFSRRATVTVKEAVGALAQRLNAIGDEVNRSYREMALQASPALLQQWRTRFVFAEGAQAASLAQQRVVNIRILTFLFMFAEMLSRSFLPLYIGELPQPAWGLSPEFMASLPMTANLLCVALCLPAAGRWSDRLGRRSSYLLGAAVLVTGLLLSAFGGHFLLQLLARMVAGVGYALLYMACQGYVIDNTSASNRSQGMAAFVSAIMVSEICAPAVGGILADRIGYGPVFVFGALCAVLATLLALRTLDDRSATVTVQINGVQAPLLPLLLRNRRFVAVAFLAGVPAKLLLSGFLVYLVPVILSGMQATPAEIGRYAMVYGLISLALAPQLARLIDRRNAHVTAVTLTGLISGAGLLCILLEASATPVLIGIAALGLGQSLGISAQLALVTRVTQAEMQSSSPSAVLGMYRMIERLGGALGPVIAGLLVALVGAPNAMALLGALALLAALSFLALFLKSASNSGSPSA